jgi:hypothetical protein
MVQLQVAVPPGVQPGGLMTIQAPDGRQVQVAVPQGMAPGAQFVVEIPDAIPVAQNVAIAVPAQNAGATPTTMQVQQQQSSGGCCSCTNGLSLGVNDPNFKSELKVQNAVDYGPRKLTDPIFLGIYLISFLVFFILCLTIVGSSKTIYNYDASGVPTYSQDVFDGHKQCCDDMVGGCSGGRRLEETVESDWDMWNFLSGSPEIPAVLVIVTLAIGVIWIALFRAFAIPIVFATMFTQVGMYVYMAKFFFDHGVTWFGAIYLILAIGTIIYVYVVREQLKLTGILFSQAALMMKENPGLFVGLILFYGIYCLYVFLMFTTFIKAAGVVEFKPIHMCQPTTAGWVGSALNFIIFQYIWTTFLYSQIRLSVVAGVCGTWYFHKDQRVIPAVGQVPANPTLFFMKRAITTSVGTLSVSALILAVVEWIRLKAFSRFWFLDTLGLICRLFYCCFQSFLNAITSYTTITHTLTGHDFWGSVNRAFGILRRNFVGAYVADSAGRATIKLGIWVFSICMTMLTWYWIDDHYGWHFFSQTVGAATVDSSGTSSSSWETWYLMFCYMLMMYLHANPIVGLLIVVVLISPIAKTHDPKSTMPCDATWCIDKDNGTMLSIWFGFWLAMFIGTVANLIFTYIGNILQDSVTSIFLCYAIDQDNGAIRPGELCVYLQKMPAMGNPMHKADGSAQAGEMQMGAVEVDSPLSRVESDIDKSGSRRASVEQI